ncbi:NB-LRR type disease resistance protein [Quillaja saponaria]|uniref:NB-LRR type disease resistance protein n=1 Tax=Quillaja saponaria TaxID=32244 RepID=A0AAD7KYD8_QUISA|nr:NB-LRR type disease resistance protein [Quillaja saponaria]
MDDDKVKHRFDLKAWVCVSEELDAVKVTKTVLEAVSSCSCDTNDLNVIQLDLKERLKGKKFLLVLDDVWNENYDNWEILRRPFNYGAQGSKIIVTTRSKKVALIMQTTPPHYLEHLSEDDCWLLFSKHAFGFFCFTDSNEYHVLEKIGREIVKKCGGLPLAAKTLAGLLRSKSDVKEWKNILKSDIWNLSEEESKIIPALRISYHYLPSNLKRCFVYCSIFPKDYEFIKEDLILFWMAENFLQSPKREKRLEDVGHEYFHDLASRSFFQPISNMGSTFVMHDLIHDLAKYVAGEFCFMSEGDNAHKFTKRTRYLSYKQMSPFLKDFEGFSEAKNLRTLLSQNQYRSMHFQILHQLWLLQRRSLNLQEKVPNIILPKLKCLRVLSLPIGNFETLPNSIGELIHLRYMDVSYTKIKELPEFVCDLYNLQTLKLRWCESLTVLPSAMPNLINLRHLDIEGSGIKELPKGMSELSNLQFLSEFSVGNKKVAARIGELGKLSDLRNRLSIKNLEYAVNAKDASEARLKDKKYIEDLELRWGSDTDTDDSQCERDILDQLQPHTCLKILSIEGYRGTTFPDWLGHASYHNMVDLQLYFCRNCCLLPSLGQLPFLKSLHVQGFYKLVNIGHEFYKNDDNSSLTTLFPSLEWLYFSNMPVWKQWSSLEGVQGDVFPRLRRLSVINCPRLIWDLPDHLPTLEYLVIESCDSFMSLGMDALPNLKSLRVRGCKTFASLSVSKGPLLQLDEIVITTCVNFISFAKEGLPAPCLSILNISRCNNLKSLPNEMNSLLPMLKSLRIGDCSEIESFPEGGLPPNLSSLVIRNCNKLVDHRMDWHLPASLSKLQIYGKYVSVESFPEEGLLPSSLTFLSLEKFSSLRKLDNRGIQNLTSLEQLYIANCPMLESLTEEKLPASLITLTIKECHLLEESIHMKKMEIWPKISHIRVIWVTDKIVT